MSDKWDDIPENDKEFEDFPRELWEVRQDFMRDEAIRPQVVRLRDGEISSTEFRDFVRALYWRRRGMN